MATPGRGKKDWNKIEKEIEKEEEEEKKLVKEPQDLFRNIYAISSDEVRRAMNKSFQESNGTCLSTDWNEVSKTNFLN